MKKFVLLSLAAPALAARSSNHNPELNSLYAHGNPVAGLRHLLSLAGLATAPSPAPVHQPLVDIPEDPPAPFVTTEPYAAAVSIGAPIPGNAPSTETTTSSSTASTEMQAAMSDEHKILASISDTVNRLQDALTQKNASSSSSSSTSEEVAINAFVNKTASVVHAMAEVAEAAVEEVALRAASKIIQHIESTQNTSSVTVVEAVISSGRDTESSSSAEIIEVTHNNSAANPNGPSVVVGEVTVLKSDEMPPSESEAVFEEQVEQVVEAAVDNLSHELNQ